MCGLSMILSGKVLQVFLCGRFIAWERGVEKKIANKYRPKSTRRYRLFHGDCGKKLPEVRWLWVSMRRRPKKKTTQEKDAKKAQKESQCQRKDYETVIKISFPYWWWWLSGSQIGGWGSDWHMGGSLQSRGRKKKESFIVQGQHQEIFCQ